MGSSLRRGEDDLKKLLSFVSVKAFYGMLLPIDCDLWLSECQILVKTNVVNRLQLLFEWKIQLTSSCYRYPIQWSIRVNFH